MACAITGENAPPTMAPKICAGESGPAPGVSTAARSGSASLARATSRTISFLLAKWW